MRWVFSQLGLPTSPAPGPDFVLERKVQENKSPSGLFATGIGDALVKNSRAGTGNGNWHGVKYFQSSHAVRRPAQRKVRGAPWWGSRCNDKDHIGSNEASSAPHAIQSPTGTGLGTCLAYEGGLSTDFAARHATDLGELLLRFECCRGSLEDFCSTRRIFDRSLTKLERCNSFSIICFFCDKNPAALAQPFLRALFFISAYPGIGAVSNHSVQESHSSCQT